MLRASPRLEVPRLDPRNAVVYVVSHWPGGGNDRVKKLLRLREHFAKLILVTPGQSAVSNDEQLTVPPWPNPNGLFRMLKLEAAKTAADRYLYLTGMAQLFVQALRRPLLRSIAAQLAEGREVCLLTTAPPHAHGLIGLYVKRRFPEVRWLMDWQDLWTYDENYYLLSPPLYRSRVRRLERRMLETADLNITTNRRAAEVLNGLYDVPVERLRSIHHHFHRPDLQVEPAGEARLGADPAPAIRIGFMGFLFKPPRVPGMQLVSAVQAMRKAGLPVELHVHGSVQPGVQKQLADRADGIVLHGFTPHEKAIGMMARYDYLALLLADLPNCRNVMSIKLPHYMITERPIIAIVPDQSAIADMVRETGTGVVIPSNADWPRQLEAFLRAADPSALMAQRREEAIEAYAWSRISLEWMQAITGNEA